jgi:2-polyprenyl-6-methoxyphenol hydroxylase-like FAD-dependent oxidoreductase
VRTLDEEFGEMKICISGAGIAGPSLAYWLHRQGHEPTLVERAPQFRRGGYLIDFWGAAFDVADRMGITARIREAGYMVEELRLVDRNGRRVTALDTEMFRAAAGGRFVSLPRGELASIIYDTVKDEVETIFGDEIVTIFHDRDKVTTGFASRTSRQFDLLIGADGLHSGVRSRSFESRSVEEKFLGYEVAAFEVTGYRPREKDVYVAYAVPGKQIARFSLRNDRTIFLMVFASSRPSAGRSLEEHKRILHQEFDGAGWECADILAQMDECESLYLDRVSQIRMPRWSAGRIALLGDAAYCPSLLAGQGCALAMVGAYVLAGELARAEGDYRRAFERYEQRLHDFIAAKQVAAAGFASAFAPRTRFGLVIRRLVMSAMRLPGLGRRLMSRSLRDDLELPVY